MNKMRKNNIKRAVCVLLAAALIPLSGCLHKTPDTVEPEATKDEPVSSAAVSSEKDTSSDKGSDSDSATDTVKEKSAADSVMVSENELTLEVGGEKYVSATVMPTNEPVDWSSSDKSIAEVDESGLIKGKKAGECTIKAEASGNKDVYAEVKVTVTGSVSEAPASSAASSSAPASSAPTSQPAQATTHDSNTNTASSEDTTPKKVTGITLGLPTTVLTVGQVVTPTVTLTPQHVDNDGIKLTTSDSSVITINEDGTLYAAAEGACTLTATSDSNKDVSDSVIVTVTMPKEKPTPEENNGEEDNGYDENGDDDENDYTPEENDYPRSECYIDGILIVNKTYSIPQSYNPGGLTSECAEAFERLRQGAANDGVSIWLASGFRSYEYQSSLYWGYVSYYGQASADTFSARPGHSEHQTGLAIDCNIVNDSFAGTREAVWLENHCAEYGFIIRYPQGKQYVTGYKYEPWHIRYIGDMAQTITDSGLTLEEYFGITSEYGG